MSAFGGRPRFGIALVAVVVAASCDPVAPKGVLGAPCRSDDDCPGATCGVDGDGAAVCVPQQSCTIADFGLTCAGDALVGCSADGEVVDVDCKHFFTDGPSPDFTCAEIPCNGACDSFPTSGCMATAEGNTCTDPLTNIFGIGGKARCPAGLACVLEAEPAARVIQHCRVEPQACAPGDAGFCTDDDRALNCFATGLDFAFPPSAIDCAGFADGGCVVAGDGSAICLVGEGAVCDGASIQCRAGLVCNGFDAAGPTLGLCQPP